MKKSPLIIKAFCGWGDGPDIGINVYFRNNPDKLNSCYDLTIEEARYLAQELLESANQAENFNKSLEEYFKEEENERTNNRGF